MIETKQKQAANESEVLARLAALGMSSKKGLDVVILDLQQLPTAPAKFFVIASGNVPSHVNAIADGVFETVKKTSGEVPRKMEGYDNAEWVLMDYFDVVVHVFLKEKRDFYRLEDLWAEGIRIDYQPEEDQKEATVTPSMKRTKAASAKAKAAKKARSNDSNGMEDPKDSSTGKRPAKKTVRKPATRSHPSPTPRHTSTKAASTTKAKTTRSKASR